MFSNLVSMFTSLVSGFEELCKCKADGRSGAEVGGLRHRQPSRGVSRARPVSNPI